MFYNNTKPRAGCGQKNEGFTLLEIMIALAIIGTALTIIIHTVNYHANVMYENTLTTRMYQLAKEKIYELETSPRSSKGTIGTTGFTYINRAIPQEDSNIVSLTTIVIGDDKQVVLNELILKKETY
jgi:prepilin-type N-terminal cleavage/methylation domain-containing protein